MAYNPVRISKCWRYLIRLFHLVSDTFPLIVGKGLHRGISLWDFRNSDKAVNTVRSFRRGYIAPHTFMGI